MSRNKINMVQYTVCVHDFKSNHGYDWYCLWTNPWNRHPALKCCSPILKGFSVSTLWEKNKRPLANFASSWKSLAWFGSSFARQAHLLPSAPAVSLESCTWKNSCSCTFAHLYKWEETQLNLFQARTHIFTQAVFTIYTLAYGLSSRWVLTLKGFSNLITPLSKFSLSPSPAILLFLNLAPSCYIPLSNSAANYPPSSSPPPDRLSPSLIHTIACSDIQISSFIQMLNY